MNHTTTYPPQPPRYYNGGYRYFFNGQEADNEVFGELAFQNYGFRMYDTRVARFWGVDPLTKDYPMLTPFQFASCSPVLLVDVDGLEGEGNTIGYTSDGIPFYYFNASDHSWTVHERIPEVAVIRPKLQLSYQYDPLKTGEIRPARSTYEKEWQFHAAYFENSLRYDRVLQVTSASMFTVYSFSYGQQLVSNTIPYMMKGGEELFTFGLKVYNNPVGKRIIGGGIGYMGHKLKWSPDITPSDPTIATYCLFSQFLSDTWEKNKDLFDDKLRIDSKTFPQNTNNNAKPNHSRSTEKKD